MPRKSKDPEEGACPRCRKLVPLVQADGGLFVLRVHHVVTYGEQAGVYYDTKECGGSGGEPAALDDSQDWGWVPEAAPAADAPAGPVTLGEAVARISGPLRTAAEAMGRMREAVADFPAVVDEEHTLTGDQMARFTADGGPRIADMMQTSTAPEALRPSHVELNGVDLTDAISSVQIAPQPDVTPNFLATVLEALRQAWIDETGAPPRDAMVTLEPDLIRDLQVMNIAFEPYGLRVSIPIHGNAPDMPGFAEAAGQEAAGVVRRGLRERLETRCTARDALHECDQPRGAHDHLCRICDWRWRDVVTPSAVLPPHAHGA